MRPQILEWYKVKEKEPLVTRPEESTPYDEFTSAQLLLIAETKHGKAEKIFIPGCFVKKRNGTNWNQWWKIIQGGEQYILNDSVWRVTEWAVIGDPGREYLIGSFPWRVFKESNTLSQSARERIIQIFGLSKLTKRFQKLLEAQKGIKVPNSRFFNIAGLNRKGARDLLCLLSVNDELPVVFQQHFPERNILISSLEQGLEVVDKIIQEDMNG